MLCGVRYPYAGFFEFGGHRCIAHVRRTMNPPGTKAKTRACLPWCARCTTSKYLPLMDVVILTDKRYAGQPSSTGPVAGYVDNLLLEDRLVADALRELGLDVDRRAWCDASMDWNRTRSAVFRTTWDYFDRWNEFSPWLENTARQTRLFNAPALVRWNLDKHYLQDLEQTGVVVVPTTYVDKEKTCAPVPSRGSAWMVEGGDQARHRRWRSGHVFGQPPRRRACAVTPAAQSGAQRDPLAQPRGETGHACATLPDQRRACG